MADKSHLDWVDEMIRGVFQELKARGGRGRPKAVLAAAGEKLDLSDYRRERDRCGKVCWDKNVRFYTTVCIDAGFISQSNGQWTLTKKGEKALRLPQGELIQAAEREYRARKRTRNNNAWPSDTEVTEDEVERPVVADAWRNGVCQNDAAKGAPRRAGLSHWLGASSFVDGMAWRMVNMVEELPDSRRELEFHLQEINKYLKRAYKIIELRRELNDRILRAIDRANRGLDPRLWESEDEGSKPENPGMPPLGIAKFLQATPDVAKATADFDPVEQEIENILGSGKRDPDTLKRFIRLNNAAGLMALQILRPFEEVRTRMLHKLDELDGKAPKRSEGRGMRKEEANRKAMELAEADPEWARKPDVRRWAEDIGCSTGLVSKLPFYRACAERAGTSRKNRQRIEKPNVVSLTDELQAVVGEGDRDEVLQKLIEEQDADAEPNPLEPDPPEGGPRKVRHYRRL